MLAFGTGPSPREPAGAEPNPTGLHALTLHSQGRSPMGATVRGPYGVCFGYYDNVNECWWIATPPTLGTDPLEIAADVARWMPLPDPPEG